VSAAHSCAAGSDWCEKCTDFKNEVHAVLDKHGVTYDLDSFSVNGREILAGEDFSLGVVGDQLMESFFSIIDQLTAQIEELEEMVEVEDGPVVVLVPADRGTRRDGRRNRYVSRGDAASETLWDYPCWRTSSHNDQRTSEYPHANHPANPKVTQYRHRPAHIHLHPVQV